MSTRKVNPWKGKKKDKKPTKKFLIKRCDSLFGEIIRLRDGMKCCKTGRTDGVLQVAHIFSRRYMNTRWEPDNVVLLASGIHIFWAHKHPADFISWFEDKYPERWEKIKRMRMEIVKVTTDWLIGKWMELVSMLNKMQKEGK